MRSPLRALGLLLAITCLVAAAGPAQAVTPLTYEDAVGDPLDTRPSMDIVKVTHDLRQINKSGPPSLVIELTLSAPPEGRLASYHATAKAAGTDCSLEAAYRPGTVIVEAGLFPATMWSVGCGGNGGLVTSTHTIKDSTIIFALALDSFPKPFRDAGVLTDLYSFTQTAEPATGIIGNGYSDGIGYTPTPTDSASTDKTFKFA